MRQISLKDFNTYKNLYCTSERERENYVVDFSVKEFYTAKGKLLLKHVSQEYYDEIASYGWESRYYIEDSNLDNL